MCKVVFLKLVLIIFAPLLTHSNENSRETHQSLGPRCEYLFNSDIDNLEQQLLSQILGLERERTQLDHLWNFTRNEPSRILIQRTLHLTYTTLTGVLDTSKSVQRLEAELLRQLLGSVKTLDETQHLIRRVLDDYQVRPELRMMITRNFLTDQSKSLVNEFQQFQRRFVELRLLLHQAYGSILDQKSVNNNVLRSKPLELEKMDTMLSGIAQVVITSTLRLTEIESLAQEFAPRLGQIVTILETGNMDQTELEIHNLKLFIRSAYTKPLSVVSSAFLENISNAQTLLDAGPWE